MKIKAYSVKEERALTEATERLRKARADRIGTPEQLARQLENAEDRRNVALKKAREAVPGKKIEDALEATNGRATAHTYTMADEIREIAKGAEDQLAASGVPLAERSGCTITATSGGAVANRYKNQRIATRVTLIRGSGAWYITEIVGIKIYPAGPGRPSIKLTDKAREAVVRHALAPYAR
jgi:hypothetical protein